jgi:hypothetical protein
MPAISLGWRTLAHESLKQLSITTSFTNPASTPWTWLLLKTRSSTFRISQAHDAEANSA